MACRPHTARVLKILSVSHVVAQIGVIYGNPEVTSGGNALKFYASVRLEVRRKMTHESAKGESTGIRVKAKVGGPSALAWTAPALHVCGSPSSDWRILR